MNRHKIISIYTICSTFQIHVQRLFIREVPAAREKKNFHNEFKTWIQHSYPTMDEQQWEQVMSADEAHDYQTHPTEKAPCQVQPVLDHSFDGPSSSPFSAEQGTDLPNPATYHF